MSAPLSPAAAIALVARREFIVQVKSRSFVIGLLVTLALFALMFVVGSFIASSSSDKSMGITPQASQLRPAVEQAANLVGVNLTLHDVDDETGRHQLETGDLDALLTGAPGGYQLVGFDGVDNDLRGAVGAAAEQEAMTGALQGAGLDPAQVARRGQVDVTTIEPADPEQGQKLGLALIGTILLFMSLTGYGQLVATGVVEEKQSRVVELLLATIKPWQLLAGKILGLGAVGLLNLLILGLIGVIGGTASGILTIPNAAIEMFVVVLVWYLLGFFLFAAIYAAIGSTVSRQEELNSVIAPMIFLLIIPFILTLNVLPNDPRNTLAAVLSYIPLFSQTIMPARYAMGVAGIWDVLIAAAMAVVAIVVVVRIAGRIYQNSVLRTGARVKLSEALRGK